jgi:hypothetical protein
MAFHFSTIAKSIEIVDMTTHILYNTRALQNDRSPITALQEFLSYFLSHYPSLTKDTPHLLRKGYPY